MELEEAVAEVGEHYGDPVDSQGWYLACVHLGLALEELEESQKYKDLEAWNSVIQDTAETICRKTQAGTVGLRQDLANRLEAGVKEYTDSQIIRHIGCVADRIRSIRSQ